MARLTRRAFTEQVLGLFGLAADALRRDGRVHTVLLGLDAAGALQLSVMFVAADVPFEDGTTAPADAEGIIMLRGEPGANREALASLIAGRRVVAAVLIQEAWVAAAGTAADVLETGMRVSEHPAREETVLLVGHYPREVLTEVVAGRIVRDAAGRPTVEPWPEGALSAAVGRPAAALLDELLPGLPGAQRSDSPGRPG